MRLGNAALAIAEDAIYVGIAILLTLAAGALLISAANGLWAVTDGGSEATSKIVLLVLDRLLLVFIVVELLFAVRVILGRREVVAEPFLVVGIIASIKEIIVLSVEAADYVGKGQKFTHSIIEVGVLGVLVLVLSVAAIMLRAKEREPREGDDSPASGGGKPGRPADVQAGDPSAE